MSPGVHHRRHNNQLAIGRSPIGYNPPHEHKEFAQISSVNDKSINTFLTNQILKTNSTF